MSIYESLKPRCPKNSAIAATFGVFLGLAVAMITFSTLGWPGLVVVTVLAALGIR